MNKEEIRQFKSILRQGILRKTNVLLDYKFQEALLKIIKDYEQLETNIKDSIERHKETIQDTKDFYRPLEDTIYSGSTLIELAEIHIEILERGKE